MEQTNEKLCVLAQSGDTEARNRLLENNFAFVQKKAFELIGQYKDCRLEADDLVQEGCFGLLEAIGRFDPERGTKFLTYAAFWIRKFMQEAVSTVVSNDEISLNEPDEFLLSHTYGKSPEQIVLQAETYAELNNGLRQISARARAYLLYRYGFLDGDEHPIPETAAHFRLTVKRAKKTEQTALDDLRRKLPRRCRCGGTRDEGRGFDIPFVPPENRRRDDCCRSIPPPAFLVWESVCAKRAAPFPRQPGQKV